MNELSNFIDPNTGAILLNNSVFMPSQVFNFFMCIAMSFALRVIFERNTRTLSGFTQIARILPPLSGAIFLVIVIVKSSLALSLGLVGALSIVRFRTPIKEPQELLYLFIAIGIGLGYGANQTLPTTVIVTLLFLYLIFFEGRDKNSSVKGHQISVDAFGEASKVLQVIEHYLSESSIKHQILRVEKFNKKNVKVVFTVDLPGPSDISELSQTEDILLYLETQFPDGRVVIMEDRINW